MNKNIVAITSKYLFCKTIVLQFVKTTSKYIYIYYKYEYYKLLIKTADGGKAMCVFRE